MIAVSAVWMGIANVYLRKSDFPHSDTSQAMINQSAVMVLIVLPLVVFTYVQIFLTEEQENGIWSLVHARKGKISQLLAVKLGICFLWLALWAIGYTLVVVVMVSAFYSIAEAAPLLVVFTALIISSLYTLFVISCVHLMLGGLVPSAVAAVILLVISFALNISFSLIWALLPPGSLLISRPFYDVDLSQIELGFQPNPNALWGLLLSLVVALAFSTGLFALLRSRIGKE
ncbi:hypothetical protein [Corynebacterium freiburgense]|uniref:hypothetical protein n=1 Tax=Corynebacterium freiburgense TaxID=556548 RepID=UPI0012EC5AFA|nr:hypothetical protein [Corynebacterium freiburgense]